MPRKTFIQAAYRPVLKGLKLAKTVSSLDADFFKKRKEAVIECAVVLVVHDDSSPTSCFEKYIDKANYCVLYYDDFCRNWNFSFVKGKLRFHLKTGQVIEPLGLYVRPFFHDRPSKLREQCLHLAHALEMWKGAYIGPKIDNVNNGSKAYQLVSTIKKAEKLSGSENHATIPSYFIKGKKSKVNHLLQRHGSLIVKSCSGIRSRVVSEEEFMKWNLKNLESIPVLFQKRMPGKDVRVHVLDKELWAVQVKEKKGVDYRYVERGEYLAYPLSPEQKNFCLSLKELENLRLVGIDLLIDEENRMHCLECNPSPGWAGFHRESNDEPALVRSLFKRITG